MLDSLAICNAILPPRTQHEIEKASIFTECGFEDSAERCRQKAGYGKEVSDRDRPRS